MPVQRRTAGKRETQGERDEGPRGRPENAGPDEPEATSASVGPVRGRSEGSAPTRTPYRRPCRPCTRSWADGVASCYVRVERRSYVYSGRVRAVSRTSATSGRPWAATMLGRRRAASRPWGPGGRLRRVRFAPCGRSRPSASTHSRACQRTVSVVGRSSGGVVAALDLCGHVLGSPDLQLACTV